MLAATRAEGAPPSPTDTPPPTTDVPDDGAAGEELGEVAYDARDLDGVADLLDAEDDEAFDAPTLREAIETGLAFASTALADPSELAELSLRDRRPARWGRLDLTLAWRRVWRPGEPFVSLAPNAISPPAPIEHTDTLWLFVTWRK